MPGIACWALQIAVRQPTKKATKKATNFELTYDIIRETKSDYSVCANTAINFCVPVGLEFGRRHFEP